MSNTNTKNMIPLNIYQCWKTKQLAPGMAQAVAAVKAANPEFKHHLYDDQECRQFIAKECPPCILNAYDRILPGAYKADLWRLCMLYKRGGIYLDIKLSPLNNFKFLELTDREHFVKDRPPNTIYNAFMVCKAKNPFLLSCINQIVRNVRRKYYGPSALHPTGPGLLGQVRTAKKYRLNEDLTHPTEGGVIRYRGKPIVKTGYAAYSKERTAAAGPRYDEHWRKRRMYK
jgi:mannosyltransferase OCH1-like enzyme